MPPEAAKDRQPGYLALREEAGRLGTSVSQLWGSLNNSAIGGQCPGSTPSAKESDFFLPATAIDKTTVAGFGSSSADCFFFC